MAHHIPSLEKQILVIEISGKGNKLNLTSFQMYAVNAVFLYLVHRFESLLQGSSSYFCFCYLSTSLFCQTISRKLYVQISTGCESLFFFPNLFPPIQEHQSLHNFYKILELKAHPVFYKVFFYNPLCHF